MGDFQNPPKTRKRMFKGPIMLCSWYQGFKLPSQNINSHNVFVKCYSCIAFVAQSLPLCHKTNLQSFKWILKMDGSFLWAASMQNWTAICSVMSKLFLFTTQQKSCLENKAYKSCPRKWRVQEQALPPEGVGDHRQGSDKGWEEEEGDEHGLHLGSSACPPRGLAVAHQTLLGREERMRGDRAGTGPHYMAGPH